MGGIKVYGMPMSTNTIRVLAALNEKGVDFELVIVDLRTGAHKHPNFLSLNVILVLPSSLIDSISTSLIYNYINCLFFLKFAAIRPDPSSGGRRRPPLW